MRAGSISVLALAAVLAAGYACGAQVPVAAEESGHTSATASAVTAPASAAGKFRIAGTILSAQDGHPLRHATVRILQAGRADAAQVVTSDDSGQFAFAGVSAGTYVLQGSAPGFVTSEYEQHGNFNTGIVTGAGVDTESLVLALEPQGTISLTVSNEAGEPVQRAQVRLFRQSPDRGADKPVPAGAGMTDDLGKWESAGLMPGRYYIVVQATPWYAVHPTHAQGEQQTIGFVDSIQSGLDVAYPITYYPGASDESGAKPVEVRGSDTVELSMELQALPAFSITLPIPEQATDGQRRGPPRPTFPQVTTTVFGQRQFVPISAMQSGDHLAMGGLAPGEYQLQQSRGNGADVGSAAMVRITDHSVEADPASDADLAHVDVELRAVDGSRVSRPTQLLLMRNGEISKRVTVDQDGTASFDAEPGDYRLEVQGGSRSLRLKQVLVEDKPVTGNRIHLASGKQADYVVEVVPGNHTVRGVVRRDGKPAAGVFVLMIPTADLKDPHTFYREQSDLDGSFQLRGIAAGDYTLFAVQHGWELDWHDKATYDRYLAHAMAVHVGDTAEQVVKLEPVQAQAR